MNQPAHTLSFGLAVAFLLLSTPSTVEAQAPTTFNYQGRLLQNTADQDAVDGTIDIVVSIWSDASGGTELWSESWTGVALSNGIFSVLLGSNGSPLDPADFQADDTLFLQLEIDGETLLPRQQLGSAPFAMVDEPANELQDLELSGDTLSLSDDATPVNLAKYLDNTDEQDLELSGNTLSLSGDATSVDLAKYLDDTDQQDLSLSGDALSLSNDPTPVDLSGYLDNTDAQTLTLSSDTLTISGSGSSVNLTSLLDEFGSTVFVSSDDYLGKAIGSVANADAICQGLADAAGLDGTFLAWLSDSSVSPATRFDRFGAYYRVDGARIADDWDDLTDGSLDARIQLDENGANVADQVWTGTAADGTALGAVCGDWSDGSVTGRQGRSSDLDSDWTARNNTSCNASARIYCFEQVLSGIEDQKLSLSGDTLTLTSPDGDDDVDLSGYLDNTDDQVLSLSGNTLRLTSDNGTDAVDLSPYLDDTDTTVDNQQLSLSGNSLLLTSDDGIDTVDLSGYLDDTTVDNQQLSLSGNSLQLTSDDGADTVDLSSLSLTATSYSRPVHSNSVLDNSSNDVGTAPSVTLGVDGLGLISYAKGSANSLYVAHCDDIGCTSATTTQLDTSFAPDSTAITVGGNGLGLIGYCDGSEVKLARCDDLSCTSASTLSVDTGVCTSVSIALSYFDSGSPSDGEGRAILAYDLDGELRTATCDDGLCTGVTTSTLDTAGGGYNSIAVGPEEKILISYAGTSPASLKLARCTNTLCTGANLTTLVTADARYTSITTGRDGLGLISYHDADRDRLVVAHCDDSNCTSVTTTDLSVSHTYSSITIGSDGLGVIAAHQNGNARRHVIVYHCSDVECSSSIEELAVSSNSEGYELSITIGVDGMPLIVHHRGYTASEPTTGDLQLKALHCSNVFCTPFARRR